METPAMETPSCPSCLESDDGLQADAAYQRMLRLEATREQALRLLPAPGISPRQHIALGIMHRQDVLDCHYHARSLALARAGLAARDAARLQQELAARYLQARQQLMHAWPRLTSAEYEALPLLLMRHRLSQEIDQQLEALRLDLCFDAAG